MTSSSYNKVNCPISGLLSQVGDQWTLLIVRDLLVGVERFDDIQRSLQLSRNILTQRLNRLVKEGFVEKIPVREGVSRWRYKPTEKCEQLLPILLAMSEWGERWTANAKGKRTVAIDKRTGSPVKLELRRESDRKQIAFEHLLFKAGPGADAAVKRHLGEYTGR
ncbi:MAG: winged helix-turn-helix transcriptional regulator [Pseudomonadales bacterium]